MSYVVAGTQLAMTVLLGFLGGYYLDRKLGWEPWAMLAGAFLGLALGLYNFLAPFMSGNRKDNGSDLS